MVQKESPIPSSSDKSHVIRTSDQWNSSGDQYHVIPRGVLCIELTSNGKTKIKVGEGNKCYSQLPYISDIDDLSNYYTKEEVDLIVENLEFMSIKSTEEYESRNQLPKTGNKLGDVRFVKNPNNQYDDPLLYVWNGSKWVFSGGSIINIDLSEYCKKSEILPRLQQLEALSHAHRNKAILDSTSAIYTTEKDEKLESLKNYDVFVPATEEEDGADGLVPAPSASETNKFLRGDGTWADAEGEKYSAGDGISFETKLWRVSEEFVGHESEWTNWTFYDPTSPEGEWWHLVVSNAENQSTRCHEIISRTLKIEAWDINDRALWTYVYLYDQNGTHYASTDWNKTGTRIEHIIPDSAVYFGIGLARLPDTDTQYSDDRREGINPSEIKSVKVMWVVEDSEDESETYIHNEGVLDITQDNPNVLNKLTVHFRESSKEITIPSGGGTYVLPPATDSTLGGIIVGDGLAIDEDGILSATGGGTGGYYAGHGIEFKNVNPDNVPGEYTVVEYIGNTSASYILTDYVPNTNTKIVADMNVHQGTASWQTIFGARDDVYPGGNEYALFSRVNNDYHFYPRITGNSYDYMTGAYDERITVMIEGNVVTVTKEDQTSYSYTQSGSLSNLTNPITIFALHNGNNVGDAGLLELYSFKVYENDTLLKNYVPCYRTSDDTIGLYETIDGVFYTNGGTGNFSKGEDIETLKTINAKIGTGLSFDSNDNIVNEGVLEVSEKQSAPGVFTVSKRDADTDIDLFSSLGKITLNCNMNPD